MTTVQSSSLESLVAGWRDELQSHGLRDRADVDELELHLLDTIDALRETGLNETEAFAVARLRLGCSAELADQLDQAQGLGRWHPRLLWMGVGAGTLLLFANILPAILSIVLVAATRPGASTGLMAAIAFLTPAFGIGTVYVLRSKIGPVVEMLVTLGRRRSAWELALLLLFVGVLVKVGGGLSMFVTNGVARPDLLYASHVGLTAWALLGPAALVLVVAHMSRGHHA